MAKYRGPRNKRGEVGEDGEAFISTKPPKPTTSPECQIMSSKMWRHCSLLGCDNPMHETNKGTKKRAFEQEVLM